MTPIAPNGETACLQELIWPETSTNLLPLYFFAEHKNNQLPEFELKSDGLIIRADTTLSFSTLLNSFYECAWNAIAELSNLYFKLDFRGYVKVEIFRASAANPRGLLLSRTVKGGKDSLLLDIPLNTGVDAGRLFVTITAMDDQTEILGGAWHTSTKPANEVALRIVICTFNKEKYLLLNLQKLLGTFANKSELKEIIVVNQGEGDLAEHPGFTDLPGCAKLKIIHQENFGGSGGFTRGIIDSLESQDTSHILLCDDDVTIDPVVIHRLIAMLQFNCKRKIIGGQMLEQERPTRLYASDERFEFSELLPVNPLRDVDFACRKSIEHFNVYRGSEYNGWWFCCLSRSAFEPDNLPLPFFVRGDDIEFAYRLKPGSIVTMPGIFVWHESFHFKNSSLMEYFTARNWLILSLLHSDIPISRLLYAYHGMFWWFVVTFRYDLAHARLLALRDFMKGPAYVFASPIARHRDLISELDRYAPELVTMQNNGWKSSGTKRKRTSSRLARWIDDSWNTIWVLFLAPASRDFSFDEATGLIHSGYDDNDFFRGKKAVGVLNETTQVITIQAASRRLSRLLYWQFLKELFQACQNQRSLARRYREEYRKFTTLAYWQQYFGI